MNNYVYIGSTTLPLTKRLGDHIYTLNIGTKSGLYNHIRQIGIDKWVMKLLEHSVVGNIGELRILEQKWIDKENPSYLLNFKNAVLMSTSLNEKREIEDEFQNLNLND
jgi:hypothetical protein